MWCCWNPVSAGCVGCRRRRDRLGTNLRMHYTARQCHLSLGDVMCRCVSCLLSGPLDCMHSISDWWQVLQ